MPSLISSWRFWPAVHVISYSPLIPFELKVLWIDTMEIFWVAILSVINANAASKSGKAYSESGSSVSIDMSPWSGKSALEQKLTQSELGGTASPEGLSSNVAACVP